MSTIKRQTIFPSSTLCSLPTHHEDDDAITSSSAKSNTMKSSKYRFIATFMIALAGTWLSLASVGSAAPPSTAPAPASTESATKPGSTTKPKTEADVRKIAEQALRQYIAERTKRAIPGTHDGTGELTAAPEKSKICIFGVCASCGTEDLGEKTLTTYCMLKACGEEKCYACVVTDNLGNTCAKIDP